MFGIPNKLLWKAKLLFCWRRLGTPPVISTQTKQRSVLVKNLQNFRLNLSPKKDIFKRKHTPDHTLIYEFHETELQKTYNKAKKYVMPMTAVVILNVL